MDATRKYYRLGEASVAEWLRHHAPQENQVKFYVQQYLQQCTCILDDSEQIQHTLLDIIFKINSTLLTCIYLY